MAGKGKVATIILAILVVISLSLTGGIYYLLQKEHAKNLALQQALDELNEKQKRVEEQLNQSKQTIVQLGNNLEEARTQIDNLNKELNQEKVVKEEALSQIKQLKSSLEQQKTLRADLESKLSLTQKDAEKIQARVKELESKKSELEARVTELEEKQKQAQAAVELGKVVVTPEGALPSQETTENASVIEKAAKAAAPSEFEGKVLVVNKEYDFVVINLGSKDGIGMGDIYSLYHGNQYLGDVKIEKIHDSMAAGGFLSPDIKNKVNEGDRVVKKGR
jgi:outer membrane murein-binding lipoprotein Lpp